MHNFDRVKLQVERLEKRMVKKFPGCGFTTTVLLWDDGTTRIQCRHGDEETLHDFVYYKNKITYHEHPCNLEDIMVLDESGNERLFELVERKIKKNGRKSTKNTPTRRYSRAEFDEFSKFMMTILENDFARAAIPLFYRKKESFGDIDILVTGGIFMDTLRNYIEMNFHPNEIFHNGNCYSFDVREFQVDLITCEPEDFDTNLMYLSYNDLGNYIGRIAQGFGLKYGQEGLWYEHYFKGQNIGTLPVSKDYPKIFEFLGLDYKVWEAGFDTLEDIFKFIAYSPYFNWEMYQLESLNKINRDRNAKRASYMSFLQWIDDNIVDKDGVDSRDYMYPFFPDKTVYFNKFDEVFPEARLDAGVRKLEYLKCKDLYIRSKFSGDDIANRFGLEGKALGEAMKDFKNYLIPTNEVFFDFEKYILETSESEIYEDFSTYLKARKNLW